MWKIATLVELVIILSLSLYICFENLNIIPDIPSGVSTRTITQTKRETKIVAQPGKDTVTTITEYITADNNTITPSSLPMWSLTGGGRINIDGKKYWQLGLERRLWKDIPLHSGIGYDSEGYILSTIRLELK